MIPCPGNSAPPGPKYVSHDCPLPGVEVWVRVWGHERSVFDLLIHPKNHNRNFYSRTASRRFQTLHFTWPCPVWWTQVKKHSLYLILWRTRSFSDLKFHSYQLIPTHSVMRKYSNLCTCVCMIYTYTYIIIYNISIYIYTYTHIHIYMYTYIYIHTNYIYVYI